jgi:hypothetical protein
MTYKMKGFSGFKGSPAKQNESVQDSTTPTNVKKIEISVPEKYNPGKDAPGPGTVYDPGAKRLEALKKSNPISSLFSGRG